MCFVCALATKESHMPNQKWYSFIVPEIESCAEVVVIIASQELQHEYFLNGSAWMVWIK